jgi:transposase
MLTAIWHMLATGELYNDPGANYFTRDPTRQIKRLVTQLEALGQHVTLQKAAA